jgi:hypothetical protein
MSAIVLSDRLTPHPPPQHASAEAYAAFLWTRPSLRSRAEFLKARRRFVRLYPNLEEWFAAPLAERVGWTTPRAGIGYGVARARPYLTFLAYGGYARFDWPWILAINHHVVSSEWLRPEVDRYIQALAAEAVCLGYGRVSSHWHLRRTLKYCYLHDPDRVLHLEEADLATFEEALRTFGARPDVAAFFGSAAAYQKAVRSHRHSLFTLRTVLYHRGQLAVPPKRQGGRPSPLRVPPRMAALIERYQGARRAGHAQPGTVTRFGSHLRHFGDWLQVHHPRSRPSPR